VKAPVYGANNWYYAYGISSPQEIIRDSQITSELSPDTSNRPFSVIDAGWQYAGSCYGSPWNCGNRIFPDMPLLAADIRRTGCQPGIWYRPLLNNQFLPDAWLLSPQRFSAPNQPGTILDPSVPEVVEILRQDMSRFAAWGYALVKHDFSTFDLFGRWGFQMDRSVTDGAWSFHDTSRTSAEIVGAFYQALSQAAGPQTILIGCNTIGHLAAGSFHLQRTGDDTSGREWERTRKMGINTLAFRAPQHRAFFEVDADCVGLTGQIPWELNRQWLDLLSRSGMPLFVSASPDALGPEPRAALRAAYARAARPAPTAEPLDWLETTTPARWNFGGEVVEYSWSL
jgi:alpha-galactosidase